MSFDYENFYFLDRISALCDFYLSRQTVYQNFLKFLFPGVTNKNYDYDTIIREYIT